MEARSEQGLKGGALSTLEATVVSMGFMAPSVATFFNTPFIAQFASTDEPDTTQEDVRRKRDAAEGQAIE